MKDTANVRYRIASCLEALGRRAEALGNYEAAAKLAEQEKVADVLKVAAEHAADLDRQVPRLSVVLPTNAPAATEVRVDDAPVDRSSLAGMLLDVGHHTIRATAPGDSPFETAVTLPEGGRVSISVVLTPAAAPPGQPPGQTPGQGPSGPPGDGEKNPPVTSHPSHVGAWIAIGVGGALAVGSVVSLVLRQSNISTINNDCPNLGACDPKFSPQVQDARSAAQWQGPLAIGLGAGAVVGLGISAAWLLAASPSRIPSARGPSLITETVACSSCRVECRAMRFACLVASALLATGCGVPDVSFTDGGSSRDATSDSLGPDAFEAGSDAESDAQADAEGDANGDAGDAKTDAPEYCKGDAGPPVGYVCCTGSAGEVCGGNPCNA